MYVCMLRVCARARTKPPGNRGCRCSFALIVKAMAKKYNCPHRCSGCGAIGHRIETCTTTKKKSRKSTRAKNRMSRADKRISYTNQGVSNCRGLTRVKQVGYPEICAFTEKQAKAELNRLKLLPTLVGRKCWACGAAMKRYKSCGPCSIVCPMKKCRRKIQRADLAYTPLWAKQSAGHGSSYKTYLRALYVYGLKIPQDSAQHLTGVGEKENAKWCQTFRFGTAFAELHTGRETHFDDGTLEWDGTKSATIKNMKKKYKQVGRFIVVMHRETGGWALEPLEDKDVLKGAPPPPETYDEIKGPLLRKVHAGHVASSDGAQAFKKFAKKDLAALGVPHATVVHGKKEYSRVVRVPLSSLSKRIRDRVAQLPTSNSRSYRFKAGDQQCEGFFSVVKRNLKRLNLKGRTTRASINFLASAWLARGAGLEAVAKGMAIYQKAMVDTVHPNKVFKDSSWLRALEPA
jgi:hypothetical protein